MKTQNSSPSSEAQNEVMEAQDEMQDELRPEYDASLLKNGVRGKHLVQYRAGTNLVLLAPDVAAAFPTEQAVNEALRRLMQTQEAA